MCSGGLEPQHELAVPPEDAGFAGGRCERKGPGGVVVNGPIELADDVVQHSPRHRKGRPAIAALTRMADAIAGSLRKVDRLIHVGSDASAAEVIAEDTMAHEDDVVAVAVFLA